MDISIAHGGKNDIRKHVGVKHHIEMSKAASSSRSMSSFVQSASTDRVKPGGLYLLQGTILLS